MNLTGKNILPNAGIIQYNRVNNSIATIIATIRRVNFITLIFSLIKKDNRLFSCGSSIRRPFQLFKAQHS